LRRSVALLADFVSEAAVQDVRAAAMRLAAAL
jgi:hypothetical protein